MFLNHRPSGTKETILSLLEFFGIHYIAPSPIVNTRQETLYRYAAARLNAVIETLAEGLCISQM